MVPKPRTELVQWKFLCGKQAFRILDGDTLEIRYDRFTLHQQFQIPLWEILPDPERLKDRPIGTTVGVGIFGILLLALIVVPFFIHDLAVLLIFPGLFITIFFFACLCKLQMTSVDSSMFRLRNGGYLHVWYERPDKSAFVEFCDHLRRTAKQAWDKYNADIQGHTIAAEILDLKKLADDGVLTQEEYKKLKERIVEADQRQIGFR